MAKRDRDTDIWKDNFYRNLPPLYKNFWDYINDDCDNSGVWITDFKTASGRIGRKIRPGVAMQHFGDRVQVFDHGNKWHIKTFVFDKLGFTNLNPTHRFQKSILDLLSKHKIKPNGVYPDTLQSVKDTGREEKGKEGAQGGLGESTPPEPKPPSDDLHTPLSEQWFDYIFDEGHLEMKAMTYIEHDVKSQFQKFKSKVLGSPGDYIYRDTDGMRKAFDYQLRNTKPQKKYAGAQRTLTETSPDPGKDYSEKF